MIIKGKATIFGTNGEKWAASDVKIVYQDEHPDWGAAAHLEELINLELTFTPERYYGLALRWLEEFSFAE